MSVPVNDTIAAIATPSGRGGVGVIRVSGPEVPNLVETLFGQALPPRQASFRAFKDSSGDVLDRGLAVYFPGTQSFTGEPVLELQAHGSPVVLNLLLQRLYGLGVRPARAGEFSERAFLHDKIDLAQAEAIADLIAATTEQAARAAQRSLDGEFSRHIDAMLAELVSLRTFVEASIDFVDEDIDFLDRGRVAERLGIIAGQIEQIRRAARQGSVLREGLTVVIAGPPNAGKSSLLNALAGRDAAIVSDTAGTTRDVLREYVQIDGMPLHVLDTAGLRESDDAIEQEGIRRARAAIARADRVLIVQDDRDGEIDASVLGELPETVERTLIRNKIDLSGRSASMQMHGSTVDIALSLKTGAGMDLLREHLKALAGFDAEAADVFSARARHLDALARAGHAVQDARALVDGATELLAEELRAVQQALSEITGAYTTEDLLGSIFGAFCIGK